MEDTVRWKTTFDGRQPSLESDEGLDGLVLHQNPKVGWNFTQSSIWPNLTLFWKKKEFEMRSGRGSRNGQIMVKNGQKMAINCQTIKCNILTWIMFRKTLRGISIQFLSIFVIIWAPGTYFCAPGTFVILLLSLNIWLYIIAFVTLYFSNYICQILLVVLHLSHSICHIAFVILHLSHCTCQITFVTVQMSHCTYHIALVILHLSHWICHIACVQFVKWYLLQSFYLLYFLPALT